MNKKYQKKTILQVLPSLISGGVERGTLEVAQKIIASKDNALVVSSGGPMVEMLEQIGAKHIAINVDSKNPYIMYRNIQKLIKIIGEYNVDLIHARSRAPAWSAYFAARAASIPMITTFHGAYNFNNPIKKYYNSIMTKGQKIIAVSRFIQQHIIKHYKIDENKISLIHRGVDHNQFSQKLISPDTYKAFKIKYKVPDGTKVLLLPSRITRWKGHHILIEALSRIHHANIQENISSNFYCIIAGDGTKNLPYTESLQKQILQHKLKSHVKIFDNEVDMLHLYGISDIVLSPSIEPEAFGRTIVEAQSMEKIVIGGRLGGANETIQHCVTGLTYDFNNIDKLTHIIDHALSLVNSDDGKKMTSSARKSVIQHFSLDIMLQKTMIAYESLLY